MYFRRQKSTDILVLDDFFANLNTIDDGIHNFDFSYKISVADAFKMSALSVRVSIYSKIVAVPTIDITSSDVVGSSLAHVSAVKLAKLEQEKYSVFSTVSDVTSVVDNTLIDGITKGLVPEEAFSKNVLRVRKQGTLDENASLIFQNPTASVNNSAKKLSEKMLTTGRDPSSIVDFAHYSVTPVDAVMGTAPSNKKSTYDICPDVELLSMQLENAVDGASTNIVEYVTVNDDVKNVRVPVAFDAKVDGKKQSLFHVFFELVNSSGEIVQTAQRVLDVSRHEMMMFTPRKAPIVTVASSNQFFTVFNVKSRDDRTISINVYKKSLSRSETIAKDYEFVENILLSDVKKGATRYNVPNAYVSDVIYRFVPIGRENVISSDFTNVVVKASKRRQKNSVAISLEPAVTGVNVTVSGFSTNVASVQVLVKDVTVREKTYRTVGTPFLLDHDVPSPTIQHTDTLVVDGRTYEYAAKLYYVNGIVEVTRGFLLHYIVPKPGKVTTVLNDMVVERSPVPNVKFSIDTTLISTSMDVVKELLENSRVLEFFKNDVHKEREFLSSLLAHNVQRVDITTGEREDFGVMTGTEFDDNAMREKNSVSPLAMGHSYRYEINTLLRAPETLFQELVKEKVDVHTKKQYKFNPAKFFHPITLKEGVIVSNIGLATRYAKDQMMYGNIGVSQSANVSFDKDTTQVQNLSVVRFDRDLNIISWSVVGNSASVDHFLVTKQMNGVKTLIGKVHSEFFHDNCKFYHDLTRRDIGELTYSVTTVFNDYTTGLTMTSQPVIVEEV